MPVRPSDDQPTRSELAERIVATVAQPTSARTTPGLYRQLLLLLADGEPVSLDRLATASGRPLQEVQLSAAAWADAEYDDQGRIIGYGLTLNRTPHAFTIAGIQLYTWCALDTLFFPAVLGAAADVVSPCPVTGTTIRLTVAPSTGVTALTPNTAVVTVIAPQQPVSLRAEFCDPGRFLASAVAAQTWQASHPGMSILSVSDAYQVCQPLADTLTHCNGPAKCC